MTGSFRVQIQDHVFGQGGERNVHLMNFKEYDPKYSFSMVNVDWVVKESKHKWKTTVRRLAQHLVSSFLSPRRLAPRSRRRIRPHLAPSLS